MRWHAEKYVVWDGPEPGHRELVAECETLEFARLISAAPDLLAALEMAEPFLQIMRRRREQVGLEGHTLDTVIDMVNAAISKAKGEA